MKLFIISQKENTDYDTFDSAVVAAPDEETAKSMNPRDGNRVDWNESNGTISWCSGPEHVNVRYIGEAADGVAQGVLCSSFNAG